MKQYLTGKIYSLLATIMNTFPFSLQNKTKWLLFPIFIGNRKPIREIYLLNRRNIKKVSKNALLSYITSPFKLKEYGYQNIPFSNSGIALGIVQVLNKLGFIVDVVEYTDTKFIPEKKYDLFIGHGGFNFQNIAKLLPPNCKKIYFSAGPYWKYWNSKEKERIDAFRKRKNIDYPYERLDISEEWALEHSDAIVGIGNEVVKDSYKKFPNVYVLNNAAYSDNHISNVNKDYDHARHNFLFYAGGGNVHKGLDLLIEAFRGISAHLYICQLVNPAFYNIYKKEFENNSNIHLIGWIKPRTGQYYEVVDKCAYLIYPSCADGSPGAVIEGMWQGLIPILSKEATIDTNNFGYTLNNNSINEIRKVISIFSNESIKWCQEKSKQTRMEAVSKYSEEVFLNHFSKIISQIISGK